MKIAFEENGVSKERTATKIEQEQIVSAQHDVKLDKQNEQLILDARAAARESALAKLAALGLTADEIAAL